MCICTRPQQKLSVNSSAKSKKLSRPQPELPPCPKVVHLAARKFYAIEACGRLSSQCGKFNCLGNLATQKHPLPKVGTIPGSSLVPRHRPLLGLLQKCVYYWPMKPLETR